MREVLTCPKWFLIPLRDCLDIQVQELFLGEYLSKDELLDKSDSIIVDLVSNDMRVRFLHIKCYAFLYYYQSFLFFDVWCFNVFR